MAACSGEKKEEQITKEQTTKEQTQETYVPLETDMTEPKSDSLSVEHQLYVIVKSRKEWQSVFGEELGGDSAKYAVTDLDQNGRLELIVSTGMMGTGHFTYNKFFEMDESGLKLVKYQWGEHDEDGYCGIEEADICDSIDTVYVDREKKEYYYGIMNYTHVSGAENYSSINLWKYGDIRGDLERLGEGAFIVNKKGKLNESYCYYDKKGKSHKLAKKNYNLDYLQKQHYDSLEKEPVAVKWICFLGYGEMEQMSDVQLLHGLERSYDKFGIGKTIDEKDYCEPNISIAFDEIDWQEMRYQIPEKNYSQMWQYLPAFKNEQKVIDTKGKEQFLSEYFAGKELDRTVQIVDVTGDGVSEIFLQCYDDIKTIILSKQGDKYYLQDKIKIYDLSKTGLIGESMDDDLGERRYSKLLFEESKLSTKTLAKEFYDSDYNDYWEVDGENVSEQVFNDWMEEHWYVGDGDEIVPEYVLCEKE